MDQNRKLVSVKKNVFLGVFDQNLAPSKFNFCLGKRPKTSEAWEKVKKMLPWTLPTTAYVDLFF